MVTLADFCFVIDWESNPGDWASLTPPRTCSVFCFIFCWYSWDSHLRSNLLPLYFKIRSGEHNEWVIG